MTNKGNSHKEVTDFGNLSSKQIEKVNALRNLAELGKIIF